MVVFPYSPSIIMERREAGEEWEEREERVKAGEDEDEG